jgi:cell division protein FtsI/penicillin-binding protein 2
VDLTRALSVSCNAYFHHLAKDTPPSVLQSTFQAEGFSSMPLSPDLAIGLAGPEGSVSIRPDNLLEAYGRLVREPWTVGEIIRTQVLAGLREAALKGTAGALGQRGWWAKTGTVPSSDGDPTRTSGLLVAVDDTGWAILARLEPGTGRQAAAALAPTLANLRPWQTLREVKERVERTPVKPESLRSKAKETSIVLVRLLDLLGAKHLEVRNLDASPIPAGRGYFGPGATKILKAGDRIGPGLLELNDPATGLARRFEGSLACGHTPRGNLSLTATLTTREYVSGVLAAELPNASSERRIELGAAVLRFLAKGPRHIGANVCDSTHCAWFVGRGPRVTWATTRQAVLQREGAGGANGATDPLNGLPDADWAAIDIAALRPGPALWTAHCGGASLSPHAVWGHGDTAVQPCLRHGPDSSRPWTRDWKAADLAMAFGAPVKGLHIEMDNGTWSLRIESDRDAWTLRYDEAHRRLAAVLGWDALPSPADAIEAIPSGFHARGVGWGHRVGLCLGE